MRQLTLSLLILFSAILVHTASRINHFSGETSLQSLPPESIVLKRTPSGKRIHVERWEDGWTIITQPGPLFLPIETSAIYLQRFFETTMAAITAQMLSNAALHDMFRMTYMPVIFEIVPLTRPLDLNWTMVFLLTQFMRDKAARGYTGTGNVYFRHASGIVLRLTIKLAEGYGVSVPMPCRNNKC